MMEMIFEIFCKKDAVKREVLEETGLEMMPTTLLTVECASKAWFRFVLTGNVVGGRLKTPADADSESLQAKWIKDISEVNLRANDIMSIIERGIAYHQYLRNFKSTLVSTNATQWHDNLLPVIREHKKLLLRLVVCVKQKSRYVHRKYQTKWCIRDRVNLIFSFQQSNSCTGIGENRSAFTSVRNQSHEKFTFRSA